MLLRGKESGRATTQRHWVEVCRHLHLVCQVLRGPRRIKHTTKRPCGLPAAQQPTPKHARSWRPAGKVSPPGGRGGSLLPQNQPPRGGTHGPRSACGQVLVKKPSAGTLRARRGVRGAAATPPLGVTGCLGRGRLHLVCHVVRGPRIHHPAERLRCINVAAPTPNAHLAAPAGLGGPAGRVLATMPATGAHRACRGVQGAAAPLGVTWWQRKSWRPTQ